MQIIIDKCRVEEENQTELEVFPKTCGFCKAIKYFQSKLFK